MKYFFVSDIHGEFSKLKLALDENHYDPKKDILVSVGDPFDRGKENIETLKYLVGLKNKILIWGNHDRRLWEIVRLHKSPYYHDHINGTINTILDFAEDVSIYGALQKIRYEKSDIIDMMDSYFNDCVFAIEFDNLIATHGWLPVEDGKLISNWREITDPALWTSAMWANTEKMIETKLFPEKTLLVGHWHAFRIAELYNEHRFTLDKSYNTDLFISPDKKIIAIDGCTSIPEGKVNVYIYDSDIDPIIYK